jgi:hypothetical protein
MIFQGKMAKVSWGMFPIKLYIYPDWNPFKPKLVIIRDEKELRVFRGQNGER